MTKLRRTGKSRRKSQSTTARVRIIGGSLRGRHLQFPQLQGLRPTGDRVRETLFNWLQGEIAGSCCLDMFAGSGALGFEAASRGARWVDLYEQAPAAFAALQNSASLLDVSNVQLHRGDVLTADFQSDASYNLIFVDPPFAQNLQQQAVDKILESGLLASGAMLYLEQAKKTPALQMPESLSLWRESDRGDVSVRLYQNR